MISDKLLPLFHICIRGLISHAGGSRDYSVYGGIRNVYCCFAEVSVKCTNCKFSPCKCTWLLGSCGNCLEASDSAISRPLCKDTLRSTITLLACSQLRESLAAGGGLMGGPSGDPWEPREFCDCNSYCSPYGGGARAHLLTLWVPGTPDIRG